jgi:hypothetical protein
MTRKEECPNHVIASAIDKYNNEYRLERAGLNAYCALTLNQQRPRPERGAKSPSERERGWGPASIEKC